MSLVLFDIDGTLLRGAGRHHKEALVEGIRRVTGYATTFDGIDTAGTLDCDLIALLLGKQVKLEAAALQQIVAECQCVYTESCAVDLTPFVCHGAHELLRALQEQGAALGLVTGNLSSIAWRKMELAGLRAFFSLGAFSEDGSTRADLAGRAAERAKAAGLVTRDCRISLIGDHRNDIAAARANGFQAVAVASGVMTSQDLRLFAPDILVENLAQLNTNALL
jgi:phosphoglycolate phosphatase